MTAPTASRIERYLQFSRRGLVTVLVLVLVLGAMAVGLAVWPEAPQWTWTMRVLPIAAGVLATGSLLLTRRGESWNPRSPEARTILTDEWRLASMDRARHAALFAVLLIQVPLGLAVSRLPSMRAAMAMAAVTITVGMAMLLGVFLRLDRDAGDE